MGMYDNNYVRNGLYSDNYLTNSLYSTSNYESQYEYAIDSDGVRAVDSEGNYAVAPKI